ncbi:MAG: hypothetical protein OEV07_11645, partial [Gammaproteobacteria bacterium]|nr:hypothetical protein [Gammaproteobacteria bacterium]
MLARFIAITAIALSMVPHPVASQEKCTAGEPGCDAPVVSPLQNPFYLFPWLANTTPSISSNINSQGMSSEWMNMQWMMMMANHFMNAPIDEATRFNILDAMLRAANTQML